ncbi:hypothetical protein O9K51_09500 [Purpureocillium lavendulum]|uniref:Uncharacterized protein n=1 Tax=Purpureocillium lavendulum TaxID=1247861 RepID=A0AB34FGN3_9HYPO|nr:hypothetical protein O9K51_09500 [Purpureocillium lavendulum]
MTVPTDPIGGAATLPAARGPLSIFRKIHLYAKSKKSTHGAPGPNPAPRASGVLVTDARASARATAGAQRARARPPRRGCRPAAPTAPSSAQTARPTAATTAAPRPLTARRDLATLLAGGAPAREGAPGGGHSARSSQSPDSLPELSKL